MIETKDFNIKFYHKMNFMIFMILIIIFLIISISTFFITRNNNQIIEKEILKTTGNRVLEVKEIVKSHLITQSEKLIETLTRQIYFEQLSFLHSNSKSKNINTPEELIEFCINSVEYKNIVCQKCSIADYSYVTVSIYKNNELILVSHKKEEIIGKNIFEIVKNLDTEARKKQNTEKFISHWVNRESGGIYYEVTGTFKDDSTPSDYNLKYAYQHWGKFNDIEIVVEFTTYLKEFLKLVKNIDNKHKETLAILKKHTAKTLNNNFNNYIIILTIMFFLIIFFLIIMSKKMIIKPVNQIIQGLLKFSAGDFNTPINSDSNCEFAIIRDVSNTMAEKLKKMMNHLEEANQDLERKVEIRTQELVSSKKLLEEEKIKSQNLIRNILPEKISNELLKDPDCIIADEHAMVSILFSDFKGFTTLSETITPKRLVRELNEIFAHFDDLCVKHNIEKIKTIGDAYMAVGGLPISNETNPVDTVKMGLEMCQFLENRKNNEDSLNLEIRIGIHSGPVIAGVLGKNRLVYDLWGDSVNIASRMESCSEPGRINISESTYKLVKDIFPCEVRGEIDIKGKGKMKTYFIFQ